MSFLRCYYCLLIILSTSLQALAQTSLIAKIETEYRQNAFSKAEKLAISLTKKNHDNENEFVLTRQQWFILGTIYQQTGRQARIDSLFSLVIDDFHQEQERIQLSKRQNPLERDYGYLWSKQPALQVVKSILWLNRWEDILYKKRDWGRYEALLTYSLYLSQTLLEESYLEVQRELLNGLGEFYSTKLRDQDLYREIHKLQQRESLPGVSNQSLITTYNDYFNQITKLDTSIAAVKAILAFYNPLREELFSQGQFQLNRIAVERIINFYTQIGQWKRAEAAARGHYRTQFALFKSSTNPNVVRALCTWGQLLIENKDFQRADSLLVEAEDTFKSTSTVYPSEKAYLKATRALWYNKKNQPEQAIAIITKALKNLDTTQVTSREAYIFLLGSLFSIELASPARGYTIENHFAQLLKLGQSNKYTLPLARLWYDQGFYSKADSLLQVNFVTNSVIEDPFSQVQLQRLRGLLLYKRKLPGAEKLVSEAGDSFLEHIRKTTSSLSQQENETLLQLYQAEINEQVASYVTLQLREALFNFQLELKNRQTEPMMAVNQEIAFADPDTRRHYQRYREKQAQLIDYAQATGSEGIHTTAFAIMEQAEREVRRKIHQRKESITWEDIRKSLKVKQAVVEFITATVSDSTWYYALLLRPKDKNPQFVKLFEERQFQKLAVYSTSNQADATVELMYRGGTVEDKSSLTDSLQLYKLIWKPLETYLTNSNLIYIVPSGILHSISFAAIRTPEYLLIDRYDLVYRLSSRQLLNPAQFVLKPKNNVLLLGDIDYEMNRKLLIDNNRQQNFIKQQLFKQAATGSNLSGADPTVVNYYLFQLDSLQNIRKSWLQRVGQQPVSPDDAPRLPKTGTEARTISKLLNAVDISTFVLEGIDADEWRYRALADSLQPTIAHIATHGYFTRTRQLSDSMEIPNDNVLTRSGLLMSGANFAKYHPQLVNSNDGKLSALDITSQNLSKTQLVVLSACETGLGDVRGSEGLFGLQRSLKIAGVNYILQSLWVVPDEQTSELMIEFYKQLTTKVDIETAFNYAQRALRVKYKPYNWAAFVLIR